MINNNTLYLGDNLHGLRELKDNSVDLIYLDPPFNSNKNYAGVPNSPAKLALFNDTWKTVSISKDSWEHVKSMCPNVYNFLKLLENCSGSKINYLVYLSTRLFEMRRVLNNRTGSFWLHCDDHMGDYLKILLDLIFGARYYKNTVIWQRSAGGNVHNGSSIRLPCSTDKLLFYSYNSTINRLYNKNNLKDHIKRYNYRESNGRKYKLSQYWLNPRWNSNDNLNYKLLGIYPPFKSGWSQKKEKAIMLEKQGKLVLNSNGTRVYKKLYFDEFFGVVIDNLWTDIWQVRGKELCGYPTQKPIKLLRRIVEISSNIGDVVLDPFCGCGTTILAANQLNRKWIGMDKNEVGIQLSKSRLDNGYNLWDDDISINMKNGSI